MLLQPIEEHCPECKQSLKTVEVTTTVCFECLQKEKTIAAQKALIWKFGEGWGFMENELLDLKENHPSADLIIRRSLKKTIELRAAYAEWKKENPE